MFTLSWLTCQSETKKENALKALTASTGDGEGRAHAAFSVFGLPVWVVLREGQESSVSTFFFLPRQTLEEQCNNQVGWLSGHMEFSQYGCPKKMTEAQLVIACCMVDRQRPLRTIAYAPKFTHAKCFHLFRATVIPQSRNDTLRSKFE